MPLLEIRNVAFPLQMARKSAEETAARVKQALAEVHLEDKGASFPHELSGGHKQLRRFRLLMHMDCHWLRAR